MRQNMVFPYTGYLEHDTELWQDYNARSILKKSVWFRNILILEEVFPQEMEYAFVSPCVFHTSVSFIYYALVFDFSLTEM